MLIKYNNFLLYHPWYYGFNFSDQKIINRLYYYDFEFHLEHLSLSIGNNCSRLIFNLDRENYYIVFDWKYNKEYTKKIKIKEETLNKLIKTVDYTFLFTRHK